MFCRERGAGDTQTIDKFRVPIWTSATWQRKTTPIHTRPLCFPIFTSLSSLEACWISKLQNNPSSPSLPVLQSLVGFLHQRAWKMRAYVHLNQRAIQHVDERNINPRTYKSWATGFVDTICFRSLQKPFFPRWDSSCFALCVGCW